MCIYIYIYIYVCRFVFWLQLKPLLMLVGPRYQIWPFTITTTAVCIVAYNMNYHQQKTDGSRGGRCFVALRMLSTQKRLC